MAWSDRPLKFQGETNDTAALGVYLYDAFGNLTLLYRDPLMGSQYPLPRAATSASAGRGRPGGGQIG